MSHQLLRRWAVVQAGLSCHSTVYSSRGFALLKSSRANYAVNDEIDVHRLSPLLVESN
jgi:hypothetical protein